MIETLRNIDGSLLIHLQHLMVHEWLTPFMKFYTSLGNAGIIWIALSVALLLFKRTRKMGVAGLTALIIMLLFNNMLLKPLVARTRPYEVFPAVNLLVSPANDYSFPSGHTAASFAASLAYLNAADKSQRKFCLIAVAAAILMGISRIYVGIHYPTDVIGGMLSGILCAMVATWLADRYYDKLARHFTKA